MSAHPLAQRRGWVSALVAQVSAYVLEPTEETIEPEPAELEPFPVVAVVSAGPRSGATTVARMLAAELGSRADGAALIVAANVPRRSAPPARAALRLATALAGAVDAQPCGRLCCARLDGRDPAAIANAARYLAPVVLDLPPDGSAASAAAIAERVAVVAAGTAEPALLQAVATVLGGDPVKVVNRPADQAAWSGRADVVIPDARLGARAAPMGTRPLGPLGAAIATLADALGLGQ